MNSLYDNLDCIIPFIRLSIANRELHPYFLTSKGAYSSISNYHLTEWICNRSIIMSPSTKKLITPDEFVCAFVNSKNRTILNLTSCEVVYARPSFLSREHLSVQSMYIYFAIYSTMVTLNTFKTILTHILPPRSKEHTKFIYNMLISAVVRSTNECDFIDYILVSIPDAQNILQLHKDVILFRAAQFGNTHTIRYLIDKYMTPTDLKVNHNGVLQIVIRNRDLDTFNLIDSYNVITYNDIIDTHQDLYFVPMNYIRLARQYPHSFNLAMMFDSIQIIKRLLEIAPLTIQDILYYNCLPVYNPITLTFISLTSLQLLVDYAKPRGLMADHIFANTTHTKNTILDQAILDKDWSIIEYLISTQLADLPHISYYINTLNMRKLFNLAHADQSKHDINTMSDIIPYVKQKWNEYLQDYIHDQTSYMDELQMTLYGDMDVLDDYQNY